MRTVFVQNLQVKRKIKRPGESTPKMAKRLLTSIISSRLSFAQTRLTSSSPYTSSQTVSRGKEATPSSCVASSSNERASTAIRSPSFGRTDRTIRSLLVLHIPAVSRTPVAHRSDDVQCRLTGRTVRSLARLDLPFFSSPPFSFLTPHPSRRPSFIIHQDRSNFPPPPLSPPSPPDPQLPMIILPLLLPPFSLALAAASCSPLSSPGSLNRSYD
jgi:hypothetical protein